MYQSVAEIVEWVKSQSHDYKSEIAEIYQNKQKLDNGTLTLQEHVKAMVYAQLSNNRPWQKIESSMAEIDKIFCDFDIDMLKAKSSEEILAEIFDIKCGNRKIQMQIKNLHRNIETLQKIDADVAGGINCYFTKTPLAKVIKDLSEGKYKLKGMGVALVCEYIKGIGIDVIKPDVHLRRILGRLGYSKKENASVGEALEISQSISESLGLSLRELDTILWQYCTDGKFNICGNDPKCGKCPVVDCPSRQ